MSHRYLFCILALFSSSLWSSSVFSQDPGVKDTVIVECLEKVRPNSRVGLNVYLTNDDSVRFLQIPLNLPSGIDVITCDSIRFWGRAWNILFNLSEIDNVSGR